MKEQLKRGRLKFISFILLDLFCLIIANVIAVNIYLKYSDLTFRTDDYASVVGYMVVIDLFVTAAFNTLNKVLRRSKKKELLESFKHVGLSFVLLALFLFSTKQGAEYSRATIYMAYGIYYILLVLGRIAWKTALKLNQSKPTATALLITTAGYAHEGLGVVEKAAMTVKGMFITDKTNEGLIRNIPVIVDRQDAAAFLCWEWIDKVFICGPESMDIPDSLLSACKQMGIPVFRAPASKTLEYEILKIRTALSGNDKDTGLSFFESEHDIPFQIRRLYTIYESEQDKQKGFHAHKQSWHLLICLYGSIDVMVDTGKEHRTINLSDPSIGLILHPSIWREMIWKKPGSVLCVAASGHYDAEKLRTDYGEYQKFLQEKEWAATIESSEITGDVIL